MWPANKINVFLKEQSNVLLKQSAGPDNSLPSIAMQVWLCHCSNDFSLLTSLCFIFQNDSERIILERLVGKITV